MPSIYQEKSELGALISVTRHATSGVKTSRSLQYVSESLRQRISVNTSGYASLKKRNLPLPDQPFLFRLVETAYPWVDWNSSYTDVLYPRNNFSTHTTGVSSGGFAYADFDNLPTSNGSKELTALHSKVSTDVLIALKDMAVNLAQVFAERKQTADLIAVTARRLADCFILLKHGKLTEAARIINSSVSRGQRRRFGDHWGKDPMDAAATAWLELQYGWKPLLSDILGACEALAKDQQAQLQVVKKKKTARFSEVSTDETSKSVGRIHQRTISGQLSFKMTVRYDVDNKMDSDLSKFGITNPLALAWELLPYSFVVDWFLPVGNFLQTIDATRGLKFVSGYSTLFRRDDVVCTTTGTGLVRGDINSSYTIDTGVMSGRKKTVFCQRVSLTEFPSVCLPSVKNPLGVEHALNALSLLKVAFTGHSTR